MQVVNAQMAYDYPIKPGTEEWKKFTSTSEMIEACQIPENILKTISTNDLLDVCLKYPILSQYTASNSPNNGLASIINSSNGFTEFMNRADSHRVLLNYYANESVNKIDNSKDKGGYTFYFCALELLLSQPILLKRFTREERVSALRLIMEKYNEKETYLEYFGFYGKMTTAFVANKYAESLGKITDISNDESKIFTNEMRIVDINTINKTLSDVFSFVNSIK